MTRRSTPSLRRLDDEGNSGVACLQLAADVNDLTYQSGRVLKNPGFYWNTPAGKADRAYNDAFAKEVVTGNHQAILKQYHAKLGEVGDLAVNSGLVPLDKAWGRDAGGFAVQAEWSNADDTFQVVAPKKPTR